MSPTIFSASQAKQESRQHELEEELKRIQQESSQEKQSEPTIPQKNSPNLQKESNPEHISQPEPAKEDPAMNEGKPITREPEDYSELMREESPTKNPLASFLVRPPGSEFINQHSQEKILLVLRQHPIVNVGWMLTTVALILAPFIVFPVFPLFDFVPDRFQFFAMIGWYLFISAFVIEQFLHWYYNIYIITDERIVDIDFVSLMYRNVSEAKIDKIEDVTATTAGLFGGVFNYGSVAVQTAAEKREFEFDRVPRPDKVTKFLNELMLEEEREKLEGRVM